MIDKAMRAKLSTRLKVLFIGAVILPAAFLSVLAARAINREEAYVEKQTAQTLSAELVHVVGLVNAGLEAVGEELGRTVPAVWSDPADSFRQWKGASPLVRTPFLVSPKFEILWPKLSASASEDEIFFLNANREFVSNVKEIPVYQNIVLAYRDEIAAQTAAPVRDRTAPGSISLGGAGLGTVKAEAEAMEKDASSGMEAAKVSRKIDAAAKPSPAPPDYVQTQQALKTFVENESLRQQVYQEAQLRGQDPVRRTVSPSIGQAREDAADRPESIYISEPKKFEAIIAGRDSGLIPRFLGEDLRLLFWKKESDGRIAGCVVDPEALKSRLLSRLPEAYSPSRVLAVLDENGRPLTAPAGDSSRDWRRPFVSREISELLPRWEAASYLADPGLIRSRAHVTAVILWALVLTLLISILAGGSLVLKTVGSEMDLARKKTTFVTNVSHELKTPLTSIRMFAEMLKDGRQPDPARQGQYLDLMVSETDRLTRLINNVLDFSRLDKGRRPYVLKPLEAGRLVTEIVEGQRVRLEPNGFILGLRTPAGPVFVRGDEEALKQAVLNLLSNAEKYSEGRKEIEVEVDLAADERSAFVRVLDRGIGIAPAHAKKVFQEFFRADDSLTSRTKGTGLGLPIARRIVRDHGGEIAYAPREGGGSVFTIRLPRSEGP
ncbi:MAG: HAMP domain-containing histidine kinase [Candidatus Aminicenantes bacterium]|nr:HAMP domain-containing histidine kinase [Candidatus Aminicenantes bacterium]